MISIDNIYPLIVPSSYYSKNVWDLPHYAFPNKEFILTWVIFNEANSMTYVTRAEEDYLISNYSNWQQRTFENLRNSLNAEEGFFTRYKVSNSDREHLIFISFLNSDGIGSSRILFKSELKRAFPDGYYVALPDRSCGIVVPKNTTGEELSEIRSLVKSMHGNATTFMSSELHTPFDFELPEQWLDPIDIVYSEILVNSIVNRR